MTEPHSHQSDDATATPGDDATARSAEEATAAPEEATAAPEETAAVTDPRVRDAVRRLNELSDLPPAEHVEVYEAVHSSLQESLAEASRQADESPADENAPS